MKLPARVARAIVSRDTLNILQEAASRAPVSGNKVLRDVAVAVAVAAIGRQT